MSRAETRVIRKWAISIAAVLIAALGCSTDSPTAPVQTPAPPSGTQASAAWNITVTSQPRQLTVGAEQPATVSVRIRRADDNQPPPNGTSFVISTTLGEFGSAGSGLGSAALSTVNGRADVLFFPGAVIGTALITAQLELSAGQLGLAIVPEIEPVVASFEFLNSQGNLSIQFRNTSTGDPTKFKWDFGDGETSREENPAHLYAFEGDYVVTLTVSKPGAPDSSTSRIVTVTEDPDDIVVAAFNVTIDGRTAVFQDLSTGNPTSWNWDFGDGTSSREQNPTHTYRRDGSFVVTLEASNRRTSDQTNQTITVAEEAQTVFVTSISPNSGPAAGGTTVTILGEGFDDTLRVFFGGVLASTVSVSPTKIVVVTPPGVLATIPCDTSGDEVANGLLAVDTAVDVQVVLAQGGQDTISGGFTYLAGAATCVGD